MSGKSGAPAVPPTVMMRRATLVGVPTLPLLAAPLVVRCAQVEEASALTTLLSRAFEAEHWDAAGTGRELFGDGTVRATLVVAAAERLVATASLQVHPDAPECGWLRWVATERAWRRQGLARALVVASLALAEQAGCREARLRTTTEPLAAIHLAGAEMAFAQDLIDRVGKLKKALAPVASRYDFILIDAPPSLGFFTINVLAAATEVLIPLQVQGYAYRALDQLLVIVERVQEVNPALWLGGVVLTMHDPRNSLTSSVEEAARERFGELVIPINVRIAEAPLEGQSVAEFEASSKGAQAHRALAEEVLSRG